MDLLKKVDLFLVSGWKEQDTCLSIIREAQQYMNTLQYNSLEYHEIQKKISRLQSIFSEIGRLTRGTNPSVVYAGTPLLPCVAWIPQPVLDEETGITSIPPQPELPDFDSKEDKCNYLKKLADEMLYGKVEKDTEEINNETSEEEQNVEHTADVANAALAAIRSRRRKKNTEKQ